MREVSRSPGTPLQNNLEEFYTCCQFLAHMLDDEVENWSRAELPITSMTITMTMTRANTIVADNLIATIIIMCLLPLFRSIGFGAIVMF